MDADLGLRGRREDRLGKDVGLFQARREGDPADRPGGTVIVPAAPGEISADDTFDRERFRFADQHAAPREDLRVGAEGLREVVHVNALHVIADDGGEAREPERADLREDLSFVGNAVGEDHIERGESVGGGYQKRIAEVVDIAHLPLLRGRETGECCAGENGNWHARSCQVKHSE